MNDLLKNLAPLLGTAIAGPLGGVAASFIAEKLGLEGKTVEAVTEALSEGKMTPEQVSSIRQAEIEFQRFLKTHEIDLEKVHAADRGSARDMAKVTRAKTPAILTWVIVTAVLGLEGAILLQGVPDGIDPLIVGRIMGTLDMSLGLVLAFWFGTTSGSQNKNEMLAKATFK